MEMQDQDVGIQTVRLIEKFEDEMEIYQWMQDNENKELDL